MRDPNRGSVAGVFTRPFGRRGVSVLLALTLFALPLNDALSRPRRSTSCFGKRPTITGTRYADVLVGTDRADVIVAKGGHDTISGNGAADLVCAGPGRDTVFGGEERDHIAGGSENDVLDGGGGSDDLHGNSGDDRLRGGPDADFLRPAGGDDTVQGGGGLDVAEYFDSPTGIRANLRIERVKGWGVDRLRNVSQIEGTNFADVIIGSKASEALDGLGGKDRLLGRGGRDYLSGDAGNDLIRGGAGADYALFYLSPNSVVASLTRGRARGEGRDKLIGIENLFGSNNADTFIGDARENHFLGGNGGLDQVEARGGNDILYAFADASFQAGSGIDTVRFLIGPVVADLTTGVGSADGAAFTFESVEAVIATQEDDRLSGDAGPNSLEGGGGNDVLTGLNGDDALAGNGGDDELDGGLDDDNLDGGAGKDRCISGERTRRCEDALGARSIRGRSLWRSTRILRGIWSRRLSPARSISRAKWALTSALRRTSRSSKGMASSSP